MKDPKLNKQKGEHAEEIAAEFLTQKGFEILLRNYRHKRSEIDIISSMDSILVFIEVKYRSNNQYGYPEDFVSDNQKKSILTAAEEYILTQKWEGLIRFDIIAIDASNHITHFEDAFY